MAVSLKKGWLTRVTWPVTHYVLIHFCVFFGYIYFRFLNRTVVVGRENIPCEPNTLLLSNHQSMIDSFLVGIFAFFPKSLIRPTLLPWNPAAEENFYRNRFLSWLSHNWKCIPIKKGRKDVGAIFRMAEALMKSPMTLFPEGTRSRDGSVGRFRGGAGMLVLETHPKVIPVCIQGMDKILPIGSVIPRIFKTIYVYYGEPIDMSEYYEMERSKETAQAIMDHVMEKVRQLRTEIEEHSIREKVFFLKALLFGKKFKSQKA